MRVESGPWKYILAALLLFTLLGCDLLSLLAGRLLDGRTLMDPRIWSINWYATVFTFLCSSAMWCVGVFLTLRWLREQPNYTEQLRLSWDMRTGVLLLSTVVLILIDALGTGALGDGSFPQIARQYSGFGRRYGSHAAVVSAFQYVYYLFESLAVVLMVVCFQRAGELWFRKTAVPWGSVGVVFTWGVIHFISHPSGALGVAIWSSLPGVIYLVGRKNLIPVFSILFLEFVL
jgi:hypothetical protein